MTVLTKEEVLMRSNYGNFRQIKFSDVWNEAEDFVNDYKNSGLAPTNNKISDDSATTLFYLLYSRYGNNVISSSDTNQFKYQVYELIYEFGPAWEKRVDIQNTLRNLTEDELLSGGDAIYNHAYNPSTTPSTDSETILNYINEQNVTKQKRAKLNAYAGLIELLNTDVTSRFVAKFQKLFLKLIQPEYPLWYITEEDEQ